MTARILQVSALKEPRTSFPSFQDFPEARCVRYGVRFDRRSAEQGPDRIWRARIVLRHDPHELDRVVRRELEQRTSRVVDLALVRGKPLATVLRKQVNRLEVVPRVAGVGFPQGGRVATPRVG